MTESGSPKADSALLAESIGCTGEEAAFIADLLLSRDISPIDSVMVVQAEGTGRWVRVGSRGTDYYVFLTPRNFPETIRRGALEGDTIHQVNY
jgi:hypothetical protein